MDFTQAVEDLDRSTGLEAEKQHRLGHKAHAWAAVRLSIKAFGKVYFTEKASREGVPGLFRAVQAGMHPFLTYAKLWELERNH